MHRCHILQSDAQSQCSSVNPPPTFTKLDNYQPVRPRKSRCSCTCGAVFGITVILAVLVMLFIAAFILYVESEYIVQSYLTHPTAIAL